MFAPAALSELEEGTVYDYIEKYQGIAKRHHKTHGIPASISLAQGIIESRAGKSKLSEYGNHFGIKCFSKTCPTGHCRNFTDDHHKDFFRVFADPKQSWEAHALLLKGERYKMLYKLNKNDYLSWAEGLQQAGYATDPRYAEKLNAVIERYHLYEFDR